MSVVDRLMILVNFLTLGTLSKEVKHPSNGNEQANTDAAIEALREHREIISDEKIRRLLNNRPSR